ncbi:hypothetical protein DAPPUDRAFT_94634 [Daphnia pulex]|uniref:Uncharacterized protein n=1 Tax=Daphnia pulex TaxID=6669 RepID=E9FSL7_DAPPU|nr:hypothetical protein DAPPUDRAFT_94634 [Daphnia pulex]|eukprot:EFX89224.1 hypothetical protein DAPPUDRAFT_94634 [Daphnia pulex]
MAGSAVECVGNSITKRLVVPEVSAHCRTPQISADGKELPPARIRGGGETTWAAQDSVDRSAGGHFPRLSDKCQPSLSLSHQLMNILGKGETAVLGLVFLACFRLCCRIKSLNNGRANIKSNDYQSQLELWGEISNI